ncbi:acetylglutamate kinase [Candidatus Micrarchaeota archaeon]|nr:acetylglutamate kinase [Candidatus Micrarchaeota archaeon]
MEKVNFLVEVLPYVQKFRDTVFVVKLGGSSVKDEETLNFIAEDVSVLNNLGVKVVVVHGGGPQADALLSKLNVPIKKVAGRRITDKETLEVAKMVYRGKINCEIVAALQKASSNGVGLSGIECNTVLAKKRGIKEIKNPETGKMEKVDFGYVGDIVGVDISLISLLLSQDLIPVIASISSDGKGGILNTNADTIASEIARELKAEKLVIVTDVPGILEDRKNKSTTIPYLSISDAKKLLEKGIITDGMLPKLETCVSAIEKGVKKAHIVDGTLNHSILMEVFTNQGVGTMIDKGNENGKQRI